MIYILRILDGTYNEKKANGGHDGTISDAGTGLMLLLLNTGAYRAVQTCHHLDYAY